MHSIEFKNGSYLKTIPNDTNAKPSVTHMQGFYLPYDDLYWYQKVLISLLLKGQKLKEELAALADNYWLNKYKGWLKHSEEKSSKLDSFIGKCEREYFGYDADGYTDKTIDRVFNSVFEILDNK